MRSSIDIRYFSSDTAKNSILLHYAIAYSISRRLFRSLFPIRTILCSHSVSCRSRLKLLFIVQCNFVVKTVRTLNKLRSSKVVLSGYFFMLEAERTRGNIYLVKINCYRPNFLKVCFSSKKNSLFYSSPPGQGNYGHLTHGRQKIL